jgi:hypothetical protein
MELFFFFCLFIRMFLPVINVSTFPLPLSFPSLYLFNKLLWGAFSTLLSVLNVDVLDHQRELSPGNNNPNHVTANTCIE